jgi:hypothetical protein
LSNEALKALIQINKNHILKARKVSAEKHQKIPSNPTPLPKKKIKKLKNPK